MQNPALVLTITEPVRATGRLWHLQEIRVVRERYAEGGVAACAPLLPDRSDAGIQQMARSLGVRTRGEEGRRRRRWQTTPELDAAIRRIYASPDFGKGVVRDFAKRQGRPKWWVIRRARNLGIVTPALKEPPWSPDEIELLEAHASKTPETVVRILRRSGFARTPTAVAVKIKRLGIDRLDPDTYSGRGLASAMGVDSHTITGWIAQGLLAAKRRGTRRTAVQGGDLYAIKAKDIKRFLTENVAMWDHRKCDRWWLVDILTAQ